MPRGSRHKRHQSESPSVPPSNGARGGHSHSPDDPAEIAVRLECAKLAGEGLPLGVAYTRFLDLVNRAIGFGHGTLYVTDWNSGRLLPVAVRGNRVELADRVRFARGSGLSAWVAQEGRPVVIPMPGSNGARSPFADEGLRAFLAFPLVQQGVVAGVLALARTDSTFREDEFERLGRMAEPLSQTLVQLRREARLRELIYHDAETGLSNRHHFLARVEEELHRTRLHASEFAVGLVELQMPAGPDWAGVVQAVAGQMQTAMRSCDVVANLGDGQFGILLAGLNRKKAEPIVADIAHTALAAVPTSARVSVRMRFGLVGGGTSTQTPEELLQQAAAALAEIR